MYANANGTKNKYEKQLCLFMEYNVSDKFGCTLCPLVSNADDVFCKQFEPRLGPANRGPDPDRNCLTLLWYS